MLNRISLTALFLALAGGFLLGPVLGQKKEKLPRTHPKMCPYCEGDAEVMAKAGIVSHGGFEVGRVTTEEASAKMGGNDVYWIETQHFELGFALPGIKVKQDEKAKIRAECAELAKHLKDVPDKPKFLDPWLRAHLYAQRLEKAYADMLELFEVKQEDFPTGDKPWDMVGPYWGEGPYFGQKGKIEVLLMPSEALHMRWLRDSFGLRTKNSQRWHVIDTGSLHLVAHTDQGSLKVDAAMHGHVVFNVSIMLTNSFLHYSYDMPVWLLEGIGHYMERRVDPKYNTFDSGEGGLAETTSKEKWEPLVKKMIAKGDAPSLAGLTRMTNFAEMTLEGHFATWSMVDYMQREHPGFLPKLVYRTANLRNEQNISDGSNLLEEQRAVFKDELKMSYLQFDRAWQAWVADNYASK